MQIIGEIGLWVPNEDGLWQLIGTNRNTLMISWGFAACRALGLGDSSYKINKMYVEYENVAAPANAVAVPTYDTFDGRDYYTSLAAPQDFLRVSLIGNPTISIATGYEAFFGTDEGNKLTFFAQTSGANGQNGVAFSNAVNSKVFGVGLIAAPEEADSTKDVLISRGYYAVPNQTVKAASAQIGISWTLTFKEQ